MFLQRAAQLHLHGHGALHGWKTHGHHFHDLVQGVLPTLPFFRRLLETDIHHLICIGILLEWQIVPLEILGLACIEPIPQLQLTHLFNQLCIQLVVVDGQCVVDNDSRGDTNTDVASGTRGVRQRTRVVGRRLRIRRSSASSLSSSWLHAPIAKPALTSVSWELWLVAVASVGAALLRFCKRINISLPSNW